MILKGSQRGSGRELARHLTNMDQNDHVEVHEIRGLASDNVYSAFLEIEATSKDTAREMKNPYYSLSFNPPKNEDVSIADFEQAIEAAEARLGLEDQPRAVIFHEKNGRRHAHCVWSRVDTTGDRPRAINQPFDRRRLMELSRDIYLHHGWNMPRGIEHQGEGSPKNYNHSEWMQFQRTGIPIEDHRINIKAAYQLSDDAKSFATALEGRGYVLANGRRGFVAVDMQGEIHSVPRAVALKKKLVEERLGKPSKQQTVDQAKAVIEHRKTAVIERQAEKLKAQQEKESAPYNRELKQLRDKQRADRALLKARQDIRKQQEERTRAARLRGGVMGLWDRFSGRAGKIARQNEKEAQDALKRDNGQRDNLTKKQLAARQVLHHKQQELGKQHLQQDREFRDEAARMMSMDRGSALERGTQHVQESTRRREEERRQQQRAPEMDDEQDTGTQGRDVDYDPE